MLTLTPYLKILNLESIYKLQIGKFMYQYRSGLLPYSFNMRTHDHDGRGSFLEGCKKYCGVAGWSMGQKPHESF